MKQIDNHFNKISIEEFEQNLEKAGITRIKPTLEYGVMNLEEPKPDGTDYTKWPEIYLARESAHGDIGNGHWLIRYNNIRLKGDTARQEMPGGYLK